MGNVGDVDGHVLSWHENIHSNLQKSNYLTAMTCGKVITKPQEDEFW